jgi:hypothetical protein
MDLEIEPLGPRALIPLRGWRGGLYGLALGALRMARRVDFLYKEAMKTKLPLTIFIVLLVNTITCTGLFAQGALAPVDPPAPTMKSLQEIWDRIGELEAENAANLASLEARNASNLALLLSSLGAACPSTSRLAPSTAPESWAHTHRWPSAPGELPPSLTWTEPTTT